MATEKTDKGKSDNEPETAVPVDPKEAMRLALERKNAASRTGMSTGDPTSQSGGHAHGQAGGKRTFRRKAGG
jgi:hypothetical protein